MKMTVIEINHTGAHYLRKHLSPVRDELDGRADRAELVSDGEVEAHDVIQALTDPDVFPRILLVKRGTLAMK